MKRIRSYKLISVDGKQISEHRYVMETFLGRKLNKEEVVHHINHIQNDNRIENLQVMDRIEHARLSVSEYLKSGKREIRLLTQNNYGTKPHSCVKKIGLWAGSLSIRLTEELKSIGMKEKDDVTITKENNKIIIEKL